MERIKIISRHHCWRTLKGTKTNNFQEYLNQINNGCQLQETIFHLRDAEEMLMDLSNLSSPISRLSSTEIIHIWNELVDYLNINKLTSDMGNLVNGYGLDPELALYGTELCELKRNKENILSTIINKGITNKLELIYSRGLDKSVKLKDAPQKTIDLYDEFRYEYSKSINLFSLETCPTLNIENIYQDHYLWDKVFTIAKNKLFIISGGIPIALSYHAKTLDKNIYFCEIHRENDSGLLHKRKLFDEIYPKFKGKENESWLIIDKSYTGGSIQLAYKMLVNLVGYKSQIYKVSFSPKTLGAFSSSDYAIYAGRLFDVKKTIAYLTAEDWHKKLIYLGDHVI
ncbi:hypothetical protein QPK14_01760 [Photorhabdus temperata subsp. temperata]|uniref:Uncharacterized protein n=2 Tax=Photorhabdus temperata TaxID=574560 RepID=A0A081RWZ1_PHOTE|nr:hypothetical protein [Photorhabdus temperata]ERT10579.1 hypothetical protein O185_24070 [Photorhabdus temperata J3]KER03194.1 hypothetical protein MEG1DRAFT_02143 [Photorhabdus temperata subsp. temperata Meg1]